MQLNRRRCGRCRRRRRRLRDGTDPSTHSSISAPGRRVDNLFIACYTAIRNENSRSGAYRASAAEPHRRGPLRAIDGPHGGRSYRHRSFFADGRFSGRRPRQRLLFLHRSCVVRAGAKRTHSTGCRARPIYHLAASNRPTASPLVRLNCTRSHN